MPYKIDEVNGYEGLLHCIVAFAAGWPERGSITETKTGNAVLKYVMPVVSTAPLETWTIVCTTAGGDGVAVFSVTGSTSGAQANATAGVHYDNGIVTFKITGPALYSAALTDQYQFTFAQGAMAAASVAWNIDRYVNQYTNVAEAILHGIGSGTDEIYIGLKAIENVSNDVHNILLNGYTGYQSGSIWEEQPGAIPYKGFNGVTEVHQWLPMINFADAPIEARLYLAGNARRIHGCIFFESYSAPFYLGWFLPYMTPSNWNYPLMVGGGCGGSDNGASDPMRYSNSDVGNTAWFHPHVVDYGNVDQVYGAASLKILDPGLTWEGIANYRTLTAQDNYGIAISGGTYIGYTWPYAMRHFENVLPNIDGSYFLMPIYIFGSHTGGSDCNGAICYGVPEGCFAITGASNNQENTFTYNGDLYVVVRSSSYSEVDDYMAMRLDS